MEAYIAIRKFDIICLSETFLKSSLQNDDDSLVLNGYKLVRVDNPSDLKIRGVCINPSNNENHSRQVNSVRNTVFILGDSIVKT